MKKNTTITRRKLIRDSVLAAAGGTLLMNLPHRAFAATTGEKAKVVLIRDQNVLDSMGRINAGIIQEMIDNAVVKLTNASSTQNAWRSLFKPDDVVGIKSNVWNRLPTPPELENAIKKRIMEVGVPESDIAISDRGVLTDPVFTRSTALVNTRPLRTHAWSGLGTLIKNYITFTERKPSFHPDSCADLAKLWEFKEVKGKTRLNILVVLTPLFHGVGPHHYNQKYVWPYYGLLVGFDPVAVDSVGVRLINAKRREFFSEDRPINPPPKHVFLADTRHGLGTADPAKIELVTMGYKDQILI